MKNNLMTVQVPRFEELPQSDVRFIIQHEVLHRLSTYQRAAQMGEEVQQLPTDHLALLEQSPAVIEARRALENYAAGMVEHTDALLDVVIAVKLPLAETVELLSRYFILRRQ